MVDPVPTVSELSSIPKHFPHNGKSLVPLMLAPSSATGKNNNHHYHQGYHKEYAFSDSGLLTFFTSEEPSVFATLSGHIYTAYMSLLNNTTGTTIPTGGTM